MTDRQTRAAHSIDIAIRIRSFLAGEPAEVVGAVLADLTALWLAGHWSRNESIREQWRREELELFVTTVEQLIPVNEAMMREQGRYPDG